MGTNLPTRYELKDKLRKLYSGELSREQASEWAISLIDDDSIVVDDIEVWNVLQLVGAADLPSTDREYLYEKADFEAWIEKLA